MLHEATKISFFLINVCKRVKKRERVTDVEAPWISRRRVDLGMKKIFFSFLAAVHGM